MENVPFLLNYNPVKAMLEGLEMGYGACSRKISGLSFHSLHHGHLDHGISFVSARSSQQPRL